MPKPLWTVLLLFAACDASLTTDGTDGDSGVDGGESDRATCPDQEPADRQPCSLPEGTTCSFGSCATKLAVCHGGRWIYGANAPPKPVCPTRPPTPGDKCPDCWPGGSCTYQPETCGADDGSVPNTAIATCEGAPTQIWSLTFVPCLDAGADVQRDAEPDAD